jgi:hypothetical protein
MQNKLSTASIGTVDSSGGFLNTVYQACLYRTIGQTETDFSGLDAIVCGRRRRG